MKHILIVAFVLLITGHLFGQEQKISPAYWVVETNIHKKNFSIVRLYDKDNQLIHEVRMDKFYLNVNRTKHRKMLNELLKGYYPLQVVASKKMARSKR